jgi:hypothetical protein
MIEIRKEIERVSENLTEEELLYRKLSRLDISVV